MWNFRVFLPLIAAWMLMAMASYAHQDGAPTPVNPPDAADAQLTGSSETVNPHRS
jgi:hypothetical protein